MITLAICIGLIWLGLKGLALMFDVSFWVFIKFPIALLLWSLGLVCIMSIILIPVGLGLFRSGSRVAFGF